MRLTSPLICFGWLLLCLPLHGQNASVGEAEAQKCEERIAATQRDTLAKYEEALNELQLSFQKSADLEGALAVRAEKQRLAKDGFLTEKDLAGEPKSLRALQSQTLAKMQELSAQLVNETLPRLIELKKQLTVAGRLDEALTVRSAIERLQNGFVPVNRPTPGAAVPAETLLSAYGADKARADKTYKGQKLVVRGVLGGFRQDPADAKYFLVYLTGGGAGGGGATWVQCAFANADYQFREEKQFNNTILVITSRGRDATSVRLQKGAAAEIRGVCDGMDEVVRLSKSELVR